MGFATALTKVFCFFFSKKKTFLFHLLTIRPAFAGTCALEWDIGLFQPWHAHPASG